MRVGKWYPTNYGAEKFRCERQHHPDAGEEKFYIQQYTVRGMLVEWSTREEAISAADKLNRGLIP